MARCPGRFLYNLHPYFYFYMHFLWVFVYFGGFFFSNGSVDQCVLILSLLVIKGFLGNLEI